jgi:CBS domain-containing protein
MPYQLRLEFINSTENGLYISFTIASWKGYNCYFEHATHYNRSIIIIKPWSFLNRSHELENNPLDNLQDFYADSSHELAMAKLVRDIMTKNVITVNLNQGATDAARVMADKRISSVIVLEKEQPIGIITERDFVKKICAKELEISKVKAGEIMSRIRTFADPETPIDVAIQRMLNHNIRRLPILSEGKAIGIITVTDLARHLRTELLLQGTLTNGKLKDSVDDSCP